MTKNLKYFGLGDYVSVGGFHGLCRVVGLFSSFHTYFCYILSSFFD